MTKKVLKMYHLTPVQEGMLFYSILNRGSRNYIEQANFVLEGEIRTDLLKRAWEDLIQRHEVLRTDFMWKQIKAPVQLILNEKEAEIFFEDLAALSQEEQSEQIREVQERELDSLNLEENRLNRAVFLTLAKERCLFCWTCHHIILDGWSVSNILKDFLNIYKSLLRGLPLPPAPVAQFSDYLEWLKRQNKAKGLQFWENYLRGLTSPTLLPGDRADLRWEVIEQLAVSEGELDEASTTALNEFCRKQGVTLNAFIQTAWGLLLQRYNNTMVSCCGMTSSGRALEVRNVGEVVGVLINTLPVVVETRVQDTVQDLLNRVNTELVDVLDYGYLPLTEIQGVSPLDPAQKFFDTLVVVENHPASSIQLGNEVLKLSFDSSFELTNYDFTLQVKNGQRFKVSIAYNAGLFLPDVVERIKRNLLHGIISMLKNPLEQVSKLSFLAKEEEDLLRYGFNDTKVPYDDSLTIIDLFTCQVEAHPHKPALVSGSQQFTYREMNDQMERLARMLKAKGIGRGSIVGVMVDRSPAMIIAEFAILKAGGAYLPIDPAYPEARIQFMLEDSGVVLLLTEEPYAEKVGNYQGQLLELKSLGAIASGDSAGEFADDTANTSANGCSASEIEISSPDSGPLATDLAYVIYTSGSTGKPKGALLEHRGIVNLTNLSCGLQQITASDRIVQFASCAFDASAWETYMALLTGASLHFVERDMLDNYASFTRFLNENQITIVMLPPVFLGNLNPTDVQTLRLIITGGSATNYELLNRWKDKGTYLNAYGPTEATICSTIWQCNLAEITMRTVPIGRPVPNARVYIVDQFDRLTPLGVAGELCIAGDGVGRGYLNRPELTAEKFVPNPFEPAGKMYRSGDLARWLPNGTIEFLGRIDHQVKIRGFRIELGEIENQLRKHPAIKEVVVMARHDRDGEKYLAAYLVADREIEVAELRQLLAVNLPEYMIPAYFIYLLSLPLNNSGKVDLKALPAPENGGLTGTEYVAPTNPVEEKLAQIWADCFKLKQVGINDDFFALGGHSLKAIQIASSIFKEMHIEVPLRVIFDASTIKELAQAISGTEAEENVGIPLAPAEEYYPVSAAQKRVYAVRQMTGDTITYNIPLIWRIAGTPDAKRLESALQTLVQRHASLRTSFTLLDGQVVQKVHPAVDFTLDLLQCERGELDRVIAKYIRPFDLSQAPLMRAALVKVGEEHCLILDIHHIIADGVAMDNFFKELGQLYDGQTLPALRLQYTDFAVWQNELLASDKLKKQEDFWCTTFAGEIPVLNLPVDYPRPAVMSYEGDSYQFPLKKELSDRLNELARENGCTLHMTLLAVLNVLLMRYSGQEEIIIGSPIAGRPHADLEPVLGMFVNTLALRNRPVAQKTFRELLQEVKENALRAYENQDYQIEQLLDKLELARDVSRNPLFQVMFNLYKGFDIEIPVSELKFSRYKYNFHRTKFDITFNITDKPAGLEIDLEYCTKLFRPETIMRMGEHLTNIICEVGANPSISLAEIDLLSLAEREQVLHGFNATTVNYPRELTISQLFEAQVERTPERTAVTFNGESLTYHALNERANQLARKLRAEGVVPDQAVGILAERSLEMIVGVLAIVKAGGAYLPLDADYPESRIQFMTRDAGVQVCLTGPELAGHLPVGITAIDPADSTSYTADSTNLPPVNTPNDLIYIIYTSGSTGEPKGVMVEHRNVNRLISNSNMLVIGENDRILQTGSLAFDASTFEIWGALLNGAGLYLVEKGDLLSATALERRLKEYGITMIWLTSALFNQLLEENPPIFAELKQLFVGGDVLSPKHINQVRALYPALKVTNGYGPTESTTFTTYFPVDRDYQDSIPIGRPVSNTCLYILGAAGQLQPTGVPGELCISGDGLARGYLNRPELTREKFAQNPYEPGGRMYRTGDLARWLPDGTVEFIGRIDEQVKIRGFRIELGEIENQLLRREDIKEAVVLVRQDKAHGKYLCAYLVATTELSVSDLRQYLAHELPDYMIPAHFVQMEQLPLTSNGKVDRKALPEPDGSMSLGGEYVAPRNANERRLVELWEQVLGREKIGVHDSFFDLGGNSIKLINLANLLKKEFAQDIQTIDLFHYTTISQLADYLFGSDEVEEEIIEYEL